MRKKIKRTGIAVLIVFVILVTAHLVYLHSMTANESYPADTFLSSVKEKKALIVTAHDDDAYSFSGTIFKLVSEGWTVRQISFRRKEEEKNALFYKIGQLEQLQGIDLISTPYRNGLDTTQAPYMPFPLVDFPKVFNHDAVYNELSELIGKFKPTVIFSLDDSIGGYGHPDHVFISKLVVEYCDHNKVKPDFSVKRIYQGVFPPSMADKILIQNSWSNAQPYATGKKVYKCSGMPLPDVSIDIYKWGKNKKDYMNSYSAHDRKNIGKISPYYNWYPWWVYFKLFDKEYFRTIKVS